MKIKNRALVLGLRNRASYCGQASGASRGCKTADLVIVAFEYRRQLHEKVSITMVSQMGRTGFPERYEFGMVPVRELTACLVAPSPRTYNPARRRLLSRLRMSASLEFTVVLTSWLPSFAVG